MAYKTLLFFFMTATRNTSVEKQLTKRVEFKQRNILFTTAGAMIVTNTMHAADVSK